MNNILALSHGSTNGEVYPLGGNQRSMTAKTYMNINACQKLGMATPPSAKTVPARSALLPGLTAEMIATGNAMSTPQSSPAIPKYSVTGTRLIRTSETGSLVRID